MLFPSPAGVAEVLWSDRGRLWFHAQATIAEAALGFALAVDLGYDGVEVMVALDDVSQDIDAVRALSEEHQIPVVAVHAPCLLITQRVWGTDPWVKLVTLITDAPPVSLPPDLTGRQQPGGKR